MKIISIINSMVFFVITILLFSANSTYPFDFHSTEEGKDSIKFYKPYDGFSGHRELQITKDTYFVLFQGWSEDDEKEISLALEVRCAQICKEKSAEHFVLLKYLFEPILDDDPSVELHPLLQRSPAIEPAGFVFIPVIVPASNPSMIPKNPSKQGHVRCIWDIAQVIESQRVVKVDDILHQAYKKGWLKAPKKE